MPGTSLCLVCRLISEGENRLVRRAGAALVILKAPELLSLSLQAELLLFTLVLFYVVADTRALCIYFTWSASLWKQTTSLAFSTLTYILLALSPKKKYAYVLI